jgi:hypothetical protein
MFGVDEFEALSEKADLYGEWLQNEHYMSAAKLYGINIAICDPTPNKKWSWQMYSPHIQNNFRVTNQDRDFPTIFIRFINRNHFHVIVKPTNN